MKKKKIPEVNFDVAEVIEGGEFIPYVEGDTTIQAEGEDVKPVEEKHGRRTAGTGSVWKMQTGKYGWCIQLTSDRTLKGEYGNKLRLLGSAKTYDDASEAALKAIANRDELLKIKLEKLAHVFPVEENNSGGYQTPIDDDKHNNSEMTPSV